MRHQSRVICKRSAFAHAIVEALEVWRDARNPTAQSAAIFDFNAACGAVSAFDDGREGGRAQQTLFVASARSVTRKHTKQIPPFLMKTLCAWRSC